MVTTRDGRRRRVPYGVAVQPDSEPIEVAKTRLRRTLLAARRAQPESARRAAREAVSAHLRRATSGMTCIAAYLPLPTEPLDGRVLDVLAGGAMVLVPVVTGAAPLDWCAYAAADPETTLSSGSAGSTHSGSPGPGSSGSGSSGPGSSGRAGFRRGALGIDEPTGPRLGPSAVAEADAILVPALAVDLLGHRLGRGGGHYDRTLALLARLRGTEPLPTRIAVIYDHELLDAVPFDELDQPVTAVVTPGSGLRVLG